jgi:hypothetical protein
MPVEPAARIAREQFQQIHTAGNGFGNQFPIATFAPGCGVEQPFERAGDHTDTTQFNSLRNIGNPVQRTGDSSVHEEEIDGGRPGLEWPSIPVFREPSPATDRA